MKISKKLIATLVALGVAGMEVIGHAAPPVGKTVLQTYSCNRVNNCYTGVGTGKTGWIAAHDDLIRLYEIRSDGWVRGDYPAGSGRVTRWFKFGDLVMNGNFKNYEASLVNVKTAPVYRTHNSGSSFGTVYNTDKVIVVDEYGSRKCIVYNLDAGGYKMGWVDKNKVTGASRIPTNVTNNLITPVQRQNSTVVKLVNLQDAVVQRMKSGVLSYHPQGQYWTDGECRGFATTVFDEIFENDTGAHMLRTNWRYKYSGDNMGFGVAESELNSCGIKTVGRVSETGLPPLGGHRYPYQVNKTPTSGFYNNLKVLFQKAKVGDFVQMSRRKYGNSEESCGLPHSAIIERIYSYGVRFFEANVTKDRVFSKDYTWNDLAYSNIGFTIYEPINYK